MRKVIEKFKTSGGKHCITTALKQVLDYEGCELTEEMMLGLASGLSFVYVNLAHSPMVNGRSKILEFEQKLSTRININLKCKASKSYKQVFDKMIELINRDTPVFVYVDMPYLGYLNLEQNSHFGGHAIVVFGYDDEREVFYASDRDNHNNPIRTPKGEISCDYHEISFREMEKARSSNIRPFPTNNKYIEVDCSGYDGVKPYMIYEAIKETCEEMLNPPAQLLGISGMQKFERQLLKWKKYDDNKLKMVGLTNYFQINKDGGTGGGMFRAMYGQFLKEASHIVNLKEMYILGEKYAEVGKQWEQMSILMWQLYKEGDRSLLMMMSQMVELLAQEEKSILMELDRMVRWNNSLRKVLNKC